MIFLVKYHWKNLFSEFKFEEDKEYVQAKSALLELKTDIEQQFSKYKERTIEDFKKENNLEAMKTNVQNKMVTSRFTSIMLHILPYVVGVALLAINGQIRTVDIITVAENVQSSYAFELGIINKGKEWLWQKAKEEMYDRITKVSSFIFEWTATVFAIVLIIFIFYRIMHNSLIQTIDTITYT